MVGPDSRLSLQPHLQLLELAYPVDNLVLAVKKETPEVDIVSGAVTQRDARDRAKIPPIKREAVFLAVHRYDDSVYYRRLENETFLLLRGLRAGASVATAASQAFAKSKLIPDAQATQLNESFEHASQLGWLCPLANMELPAELPSSKRTLAVLIGSVALACNVTCVPSMACKSPCRSVVRGGNSV